MAFYPSSTPSGGLGQLVGAYFSYLANKRDQELQPSRIALLKSQAEKEANDAALSKTNLELVKNRVNLMGSLMGGAGASDLTGGTPDATGGSDTSGNNPTLPPVTLGAAPAPLNSITGAVAPLSSLKRALPAPGSVSPAMGFQTILGKDFMPEVMKIEKPLTPGESSVIQNAPNQIGQVIPEHRLGLVKTAQEATKGSLENRKATLEDLYGNPEERKAHSEFVRNAAQLSHRLDEYADTVGKYGNWEWYNPEGAAKLSSLPLDISDNWTKLTNPGAVLREGMVNLGKTEQIPRPADNVLGTMFGPRNATTLEGIKQTKKVLADYVRNYENLPYTKAPVEGLTDEIRSMVGDTKAAKAYQEAYGAVPTGTGPTDKAAASPAAQKFGSMADFEKSGLPVGYVLDGDKFVKVVKGAKASPAVPAAPAQLPQIDLRSVFPVGPLSQPSALGQGSLSPFVVR